MASLLLVSIRPLTCRTLAVFRVVSTSVTTWTLHSSVRSHLTPVAMKKSGGSSTSRRALFSNEFFSNVRQNRRCFISQNSDESALNFDKVSGSETQKPEGKGTLLQTTATHSENALPEQNVSDSSQLAVMDQKSYLPYGLSSTISQKCQENDSTLSTPSDLARSSAADYSCDEHTVLTYVDSPSVSEVFIDDGTAAQLPAEEDDLQKLPTPRPMEPSYNLAPYVAQSEVLRSLVALGVDLSAVEKVKEAADCLVQADWTSDIQPRLLFMRDIGIADSELGRMLTKNPLLLKEDIEEMQVRISYLESKKFSQDQITRIVTSAPLTLLLPVTYVDKKLGYLQKTFSLTGDEVRLIAAKLPKIIPWKLQKLKDIRFYMKEMLGFSDRELKAMLLVTPRVFLSDRHQLGKRFDFLYNVMGLSHQHLTAWPAIFRSRLHIVEQRHRFLLLLGRAQYDPNKENYISLQALVSGKDQDFCSNVAKASPSQFYNFLKTL